MCVNSLVAFLAMMFISTQSLAKNTPTPYIISYLQGLIVELVWISKAEILLGLAIHWAVLLCTLLALTISC